jgi:hypothetical protein
MSLRTRVSFASYIASLFAAALFAAPIGMCGQMRSAYAAEQRPAPKRAAVNSASGRLNGAIAPRSRSASQQFTVGLRIIAK